MGIAVASITLALQPHYPKESRQSGALYFVLKGNNYISAQNKLYTHSAISMATFVMVQTAAVSYCSDNKQLMDFLLNVVKEAQCHYLR